MARSSTVHYISPAAFGITPNCNGSANDLDVFVASKAKIKVYSPNAGIGYEDNTYQEWTLKGRNRRLAESSKPYTVYARLPKADKGGGYVVFAPKNGSGGTWTDKYAYLTSTGIEMPPGATADESNWYVRMGDVSLPHKGERTVSFDTGILGTDQYWTEEGEIHGLYLSKVDDDEAFGLIGFRKGFWVGEKGTYGFTDYGDITAEQGIIDLLVSRNYLSGPEGAGFRLIRNAGNDVSELEVDRATIREKMYGNWLQSSDYTGEGMLDTGFRLWYENGRSKLVIDDIVARGKFSVYELESRIMTHAGGDVCFSSAGSKLFYVEYLDASGEPIGYTTINSPWMLRDKFLLAGVSGLAAWANRRKIQRQLTPEQKTKVKKFRCYVFSDDGTMKTRNWWRVHDLARCQTFDHTQMKQTSEGYYSGDNVSNTVYWRRVAGIGSKRIEALDDNKIYDYFDLWNVLDVSGEKYVDAEGVEHVIGYDIQAEQYTTPGYDASWNDWPAAGDDVVQFGNARDVDRQAVNVLQVTGGEPGLKVYHGIHNYRTDNTKWVDIGYDAGLQRAKADVFGDFYFGARGSVDPRDGSTYVRYNAASKLLEIKARISVQSTYGDSDKSLYDYVRDNIWTPSEIEGMIGEGVEVVQNQLDGNFTIWYGEVTPTLSNYPANQWNTAAKKKEHLYDMYYNKATGYGYRFVSETSGGAQVYKWERVGDSSILASLAAAAAAQDTADGKRRVFLVQPVPPYDEGDLWVNASYTSPITHEVIFDNDIVKCVTAKPNEESTDFDAHDWTIASKYTDDSRLNTFVDVTYSADMAQLHKQIDGKIDTFFTDTDPSTSWTAAQKEEHVDDVWFNTSTERLYRYKKTENGGTVTYSWDEIYDQVALQAYKDAARAQDTADGKRRVFVSQPTNADEYDVGDLWVNATYGSTYSNDLLRCKTAKKAGTAFSINHWEKASKYTDDSGLNNFVDVTYNADMAQLHKQIDGKIDTFFTDTDPSTSWTAAQKEEHVDDVWFNTSTERLFRYKKTESGGTATYSWDEIYDQVALQAYKDAARAQDTADGKRRVFVAQPTNADEYDVGDLWVNATYGSTYSNDLLRCKTAKKAGTAFKIAHWEKASKYTDDSSLTEFKNGIYKDFVESIQTQVDGKAETWYQTTDPSTGWSDTEKTEHIGDIWHNSSDQTISGVEAGQDAIWDGTSWQVSAVPQDVFDKIDGKADIFVSKPTTYNQCDLWIIESGLSATDMPSGCQAGDIVISSQKRTNKYTKSDWTKKDRYTDDSKFDNFFNTTYKDFVDNIQTQVDGKAETWYQDSDPSTAWTTASVRAKHVGDIWMDLRENQGHKTYIYVDKGEGQNPRYKWEAQEVPSDVFDMIDGKAAIYVNAVSSPPTNYQANDLWILPAVDTINSVSYKKGEVLTATNDSETYVASHWVKKVCYTDDSVFNSYINQVLNGTGASGDTATVADAARVLNGALKAKTEMDGGLMLTSTLVMRKKESGGSYTTWGGLNGVYSSGTTIAAWFGGGMIDHEASPSATGYATSLFRMNGSGYVAKGNITWDDDGKVTIQGNTLKTANFYLNGNDVTSILGDLLGMFELDTTTQPGTTLIKAKYSLYSVGDVSALGAGSSGGGGGGGGASTLDELNDVTISASLIDGQALIYDGEGRHWINKTIAQALANLTDVNLTGVQNGQALIYNSTSRKWVPGTSGAVNQVKVGNTTYDPIGGVVSLPAYPTSLPASDVSAWAKAATKPSYTLDDVNDGSTRKLSNYLPKSGGAMTGIITRDAGGSWIKARDNAIIKTVRTSGQGADWHPAVAIKTSSGCWSFGSVGGETLAISYDTDANYNAENNEAAAIYFPSAGSTGTLALTSQFNDYLPKSGGTLTGLLKISTGDGITDASGNGMLCYHPSDWSGVSASQWGVGAITCQGVIRSDNNPLKHYRPDGTYEIIDSKGGQSISSSLRVASLDIHNTNEINGVSNGNAHLNYASSGNVSIANGGGNVCIGGRSYSYKLTVSGSIYATGDVTAASDERKKDFVEYAVLTAEEIANAPAVKFRWKDGRDKDVHAGTYAQYWQKVLPEVVTDKDDTLGVNYGATAVVGLVNLAREVVELKKTVKEQRKVIDEQQKMMEEQRRMLLEMKAEIERLKKGGTK